MPNLNDMLAVAAAEDSTKIRTLCMEFADTLTRLPKLAQEVQTWMQAQGLDLGELAQRLEVTLAQATDWLLDHDMRDTKVQASLAEFMQRATASASMRNVPGIVIKYQEALYATSKNPTSKKLAEFGFVDNGNATLTDTRTALMWKRIGEGRCTWAEALQFDGQDKVVRFAGFEDWRLPTIYELKSLPVYSIAFRNEAFPGADDEHWSSTPDGETRACGVDFRTGGSGSRNRDVMCSVHLVRSSQ